MQVGGAATGSLRRVGRSTATSKRVSRVRRIDRSRDRHAAPPPAGTVRCFLFSLRRCASAGEFLIPIPDAVQNLVLDKSERPTFNFDREREAEVRCPSQDIPARYPPQSSRTRVVP